MVTTLSVAGVFVLTQVCKKYISPKWGITGIHIFAFTIAFAIVSVKGLITYYPPLGVMVLTAGQYLMASITLYQVIVKPLKENFKL